MIPSDMRSYYLSIYYVSQVATNMVHNHPRFYPLHNLESYVGLPGGDDGKTVMPPTLNLSSEKLSKDGFYLIDNGVDLYLWVSRGIAPGLVKAVFEKENYDAIPGGKVNQLAS